MGIVSRIMIVITISKRERAAAAIMPNIKVMNILIDILKFIHNAASSIHIKYVHIPQKDSGVVIEKDELILS